MTLKSKTANYSKSIYISKQPYILQKKQKKILVNTWTVDCYFVYFADYDHDLNNYKKGEIELESL